jgi:DNA invertase Pin-like site-specific DNA recombinase
LKQVHASLASSTVLQRLSRKSIKWLRKPGERLPARKIVIVYGRYSTLEQKQRSIDRQEGRCVGYFREGLPGVTEYYLFADKGYSGCLLENRPECMEMLELVKSERVSDIVIEAFDRLSRDIWDSAKIGEMLEVYGVRLHVWNLGRAVTRQELVDEAKRAENDRKRRSELLSDGVHQIVRDGGIPYRLPFAFKKGKRKGFPVVCDEGRKAVVRLFALVKSNPDREVAKKLSLEGFISPNGTTRWTAAQVAMIRSNLIYIGVINYRTTDQEAKRVLDKKKPAGPGEISVKTKTVRGRSARPANEWIVGYNSDYAMVEEEVFLAVAMARRGARRWSGKKKAAPVPDPFGNPICDCPGRPPRQAFRTLWKGTASHYGCSLRLENDGCLIRTGQSGVPVASVQRVVIESLSKHALPLCHDADYRRDFLQRIVMRDAEDDPKRARLAAERDELDRQINDLLENAIVNGFGAGRVQGRAAELEELLEQKKEDLARLKKVDIETDDIERALASLSEAMGLVDERLPFRPLDTSEEEVAEILKSMVRQVVVKRESMPAGKAEIEVVLDVEGYLFGAKDLPDDRCVVERAEVQATQVFGKGEKTNASLEDLAASGLYALTDEQYRMVAPTLPNMSLQYGKITAVADTRLVADATIFKFKTGLGSRRLPSFFGHSPKTYALIARFVRLGGMAEIHRILSVLDPAWAKGMDSRDFEPSSIQKGKPWRFGDHALVAANLAADKRFAITNAHYAAVEHLIDPKVHEVCTSAGSFDARGLLDGVLVKMQSCASWKRMPAPWKSRGGFLRAVVALSQTGTWPRIVAVWKERFPEVLEGLAVDAVDNYAATQKRTAMTRAAGKELGSRNAGRIFERLGTLVRGADANSGIVVRRANVRLPDGGVLRPDLVVGPEGSVVGSIFTRPVMVVQRAVSHRHGPLLDAVQRFRNVRALQHILLVSTDRLLVDHFERKDGKWTHRALRKGDPMSIPQFGVAFVVDDIYGDLRLNPFNSRSSGVSQFSPVASRLRERTKSGGSLGGTTSRRSEGAGSAAAAR